MEWQGDWSDKSAKWTTKLRADVGATKIADDGVFFIALNDFVENFRCTSINYETQGEKQPTIKTSQLEYDFSTMEGSENKHQLA